MILGSRKRGFNSVFILKLLKSLYVGSLFRRGKKQRAVLVRVWQWRSQPLLQVWPAVWLSQQQQKLHCSCSITRCMLALAQWLQLERGRYSRKASWMHSWKSQVHNAIICVLLSKQTLLRENNTSKNSDGWGWMRSSLDMQAVVLNTCRTPLP